MEIKQKCLILEKEEETKKKNKIIEMEIVKAIQKLEYGVLADVNSG